MMGNAAGLSAASVGALGSRVVGLRASERWAFLPSVHRGAAAAEVGARPPPPGGYQRCARVADGRQCIGWPSGGGG